MNRFHILASSFVILAMCFSSDVLAQRGNFMRLMDGGALLQLNFRLLALNQVREELQLSEEVSGKIASRTTVLDDILSSEMRAKFPDGPMSFDMSTMEVVIAKLTEEEQEIVALLNDDQKARLKQLRYQRMGPTMFEEEEAQKKLDLSDDQKSEIRDAMENHRQHLRRILFQARASGNAGSLREIISELQKSQGELIEQMLTDEQKKKVLEMRGEKFEFPQ